jgi:hypothetical protein
MQSIHLGGLLGVNCAILLAFILHWRARRLLHRTAVHAAARTARCARRDMSP